KRPERPTFKGSLLLTASPPWWRPARPKVLSEFYSSHPARRYLRSITPRFTGFRSSLSWKVPRAIAFTGASTFDRSAASPRGTCVSSIPFAESSSIPPYCDASAPLGLAASPRLDRVSDEAVDCARRARGEGLRRGHRVLHPEAALRAGRRPGSACAGQALGGCRSAGVPRHDLAARSGLETGAGA